ncbi:STAS domain-containing protein [Actinokineospora sp. NBRC 105648]|uniref:STAS domain-containing protein n=1 Tax=Actinokineospora sp. NBRC 105648 TaxID=3032206 RepID=UPI0024A113BB|nr:STAS domain-containing protein [Actinokineospora sp. NBRC 105648]GLZ43188.1 anti-sigma factor antagonist [Actinokineospora sp. NBRC 105648]
MTNPHALDITRMADGGLAVGGELDYTNATELTAAFAELRLDPGATLALDLGELGFCDSSGLSVLLAAYKRLAGLGGRLLVTAIDPNLARMLAITGLAELFTPRAQP